MSASSAPRPAELVLTASVARRYYLDGCSKTEIAEALQLSRFQVARLLDRALRTGLVRIEIGHEAGIDLDLSSRLQDAFGLQHAVVVDTVGEDVESQRAQLGVVAAELLREIVTPDDVLGVAWARAVSAMAASVTALAKVPVVQLTGSLSGSGMDDSAVELVRGLARLSGGEALFFYAPMTVPKAATARALRQQPEVAEAFARVGSVTKAIAGIGLWRAGASTLYDALGPQDRAALTELGVCAEFSGVLVDADGRPVQSELNERLISVTASQMRAIPEVLAIAYGVEKAPAVRAALRSTMVSGIVTSSALASAVLARP